MQFKICNFKVCFFAIFHYEDPRNYDELKFNGIRHLAVSSNPYLFDKIINTMKKT